MRKKVYKFHTLQTELKNIDPYAFCFGNTYMGVPPCTCPGSMQDHNWEQTWVIFYVLNPEYLDLFLTKMLEISQFCMIHKYKIYLILKIISKVMRIWNFD